VTGGGAQKAPVIRDTREIEERAAAWVIARRDRIAWTQEDEAEFRVWLEHSPLHRVAYLRFDATWSRIDRVRALRPSSPQSSSGARMRAISIRIAAGLALLAGVGFGADKLWSHPSFATYATAVGGHETVRFADGSEIELNTDTVIRAVVSREHRAAWLDKGEAYFRIAHDPAHPFVVTAGERRVTVLGTKFTMRRNPNELEVALFEGHVRIDAKDPVVQSPIDLSPGDVVTATVERVTLAKKSKKELSNEVSWRQGVLVFDRTPLAEVARELNRYNVEKIVIADEATAQTTIGGTFQVTNVTGFVRVAHAVLGLRVQYRPGETVISQ